MIYVGLAPQEVKLECEFLVSENREMFTKFVERALAKLNHKTTARNETGIKE